MQEQLATQLCAMGKSVIDAEARAVASLNARIDADFVKACEYCLACQGRIVVTGIGKSGHIGHKIAATLASTGSPAFYLHAAEAGHGDLGMIKSDDVVIAISNSGTTKEIVEILYLIEQMNVPLISMTGDPQSTLANKANVNLDVSVLGEACPLGLAPTTSTTATLAMGDALAIALLEAKGFTTNDFARSHPGGKLGRSLLLRVEDIMHVGQAIPQVESGALVSEVILEISSKGLGLSTITKDNKVLGIFTDGDLRRCLDNKVNLHDSVIDELMTRVYITIDKSALVTDALAVMRNKKINALVVVNQGKQLEGIINMHDVLKSEIL